MNQADRLIIGSFMFLVSKLLVLILIDLTGVHSKETIMHTGSILLKDQYELEMAIKAG